MTFQIDTSGAVDIAPPGPLRPGCIQTVWDDLSLFTHGYVEALLHSLSKARKPISTAVMVEVLEAVRIAEGWTWAEGDSRIGRVNARYEIKADAGNNRYVATPRQPAFDWLAPETLARIMEDCAACENEAMRAYSADRRHKAGMWFWNERQSGKMGAFPPLTPDLGDDGLIYFREAA